MSKPPTYEFDVIVTVRRRVHVSGPTRRDVARATLKTAIQLMGLGPFNKYGNDRHPIETIVSNDFELVDVERDQ
jgi:hypothetical protein